MGESSAVVCRYKDRMRVRRGRGGEGRERERKGREREGEEEKGEKLIEFPRPGYFSCLRDLLEQRVPPPEAPGSAHLPLTSSLLDFLTRPLQCVSDKR